jgi:hypothetical protein
MTGTAHDPATGGADDLIARLFAEVHDGTPGAQGLRRMPGGAPTWA